jgi:UDP-N-acetylglucosamine/UDP-N-acetylgalactosamine 4-epimerase
VQANLLAAEAREAPGEVFNVACGSRTSLNELVERLQVETGVTRAPRYAEARPGDVMHSEASVDKARALLGYVPKIDIQSGLAKTVAWFVRDSGMRRAA